MADARRTIIITSFVDTPFDMAKEVHDDDIIICTDGGYDIATSYGIVPSLVIGDLDSVKSEIPESIPVVEFPPEKDFTDLQLAIDVAVENGAQDIEVWGGIGGRLDQTIASMQLLTKYTKEVDWLVIRDGANLAFVIEARPGKTYKLPPKDGWYLSLFSVSNECTGVTLKGVKYTLDNATLINTFPIGVSNEFTDDIGTLTFETGSLLVVCSRK